MTDTALRSTAISTPKTRPRLHLRLGVMALIATAGVAAVLLYDIPGDPSRRSFWLALDFRVETVGALVVVAACQAAATVLFHTATGNRILTPASLGRFPHSRGRLTPNDHRHIDEAIEFLALGDLQHRFLDQLSGGQRQRAYVAMVLAQDTEYVLRDEPLNNLDMRHAAAMMARLRGAADEFGKTFVVVIHDINFAAAYADRMVALADGKVVHHGTPAQLMTPDVLSEVFGTPVDVRTDGAHPLAVYYRASA